MFPLQNQGTQPAFFWCTFRIIRTTGLYKVGNLAWEESFAVMELLDIHGPFSRPTLSTSCNSSFFYIPLGGYLLNCSAKPSGRLNASGKLWVAGSNSHMHYGVDGVSHPGDSIVQVALFSGKPLVGYTFCHPWVFFEWVWNLSPNLCFLVVRMHIGTKLKKMCFHTSCVFLGVPNKMKQPMTFWAFVALFWKWSFFVSENFWQYKACITSYSLVLILN